MHHRGAPDRVRGRTMVSIESDWKLFMRNVMIFTFQAVTMDRETYGIRELASLRHVPI